MLTTLIKRVTTASKRGPFIISSETPEATIASIVAVQDQICSGRKIPVADLPRLFIEIDAAMQQCVPPMRGRMFPGGWFIAFDEASALVSLYESTARMCAALARTDAVADAPIFPEILARGLRAFALRKRLALQMLDAVPDTVFVAHQHMVRLMGNEIRNTGVRIDGVETTPMNEMLAGALLSTVVIPAMTPLQIEFIGEFLTRHAGLTSQSSQGDALTPWFLRFQPNYEEPKLVPAASGNFFGGTWIGVPRILAAMKTPTSVNRVRVAVAIDNEQMMGAIRLAETHWLPTRPKRKRTRQRSNGSYTVCGADWTDLVIISALNRIRGHRAAVLGNAQERALIGDVVTTEKLPHARTVLFPESGKDGGIEELLGLRQAPATLLDQDGIGFGLLTASPMAWTAPGGLVAIRDNTEDLWRLGTIRQNRRIESKGVQYGIDTIGAGTSDMRPAKLRIGGKSVAAIVVDECILVSPVDLKDGDKAEINTDGRWKPVWIVSIVERPRRSAIALFEITG